MSLDSKELKFEISAISLQRNSFGKNDIMISRVKVMDGNGKYIKFGKLNEELIQAMKEAGTISVKK